MMTVWKCHRLTFGRGGSAVGDAGKRLGEWPGLAGWMIPWGREKDCWYLD
jgi:hypothetical protein